MRSFMPYHWVWILELKTIIYIILYSYLYQSQRNRLIQTQPDSLALGIKTVHVEQENHTPMRIIRIDIDMLTRGTGECCTHDKKPEWCNACLSSCLRQSQRRSKV
mmetsp:Transcript_23237/g.42767  ORF Transcript_23237/g.42767 Transcript_23237/m.42767 type:complete len:105 (+) Transcript_23237:2127-2441(+)